MWEKPQPLFHPNSFQTRGVFREKRHVTCDNFFSGDDVINHMCEQGFGLTMTRLPKDVPKKHLCKLKTAVTKRSRAARWLHPIFCLKRHQNGALILLTTFQSTSSVHPVI